ncbi:hypothetical protein CTEN210_00819 [Chaetoceros tenuissimus]|uniref:Uncharacterized protein n=1 Tax=Chaetoceros tenuissimus TaxID=426638 RepID=A0AAD3GZ45_9STRA|nr:hypothetical protein CTEN210_00819 [Chaetoceros tenuissimus]
MSATAQINITNLNDGRSRGSITIERTFPAILDGHMSLSEWETFCNEVDKTIAPLGGYRRSFFQKRIIGGVLSLIMFGLLMYFVTKDTYSYAYNGGPPMRVIVVGVLFAMIGLIVPISFRRLWKQCLELEEEVKRVLSNESAKRSNVSFHLRAVPMLGKVIECVVSSASVGFASGISFPAPVSAFDSLALESGLAGSNTANINGNKTIAQRLQELEEVKGMLSEQEYERKKSEIIASL